LLVNEIYKDRGELLKNAEAMALEIAANSPVAVKATKIVLNELIADQVQRSLKFNASISANVVPSDDLMEAVAAFSQKRKPEFKGT
jgi:enoyl-CoA hydratase